MNATETRTTSSNGVLGLHHVTAIAGDPQKNYDFYAGALGLRLVKLTVNYDDPYTYHLYYGDGVGTPGTIMTFFPWPKSFHGRRGTGQTTATAFAVPKGSLEFWKERFESQRIGVTGPFDRFGERAIQVLDPDGMLIELVESESADAARVWKDGQVPLESAIRGFHSVTLTEQSLPLTERVLVDDLAFRKADVADNRTRFLVAEGEASQIVDVLVEPDSHRGSTAAGSVHHVAYRLANDEDQARMRSALVGKGSGVSPVMDRTYFHSIYFREPGGVLFEIATDAPGFAVDEPADELGSKLVLPKWLEPDRAHLEQRLPKLDLRVGVTR